MTTPLVQPFRAGTEPGIALELTAPAFTGAHTLLADISEFQPNLVDALYLQWSKAIVIRCAYGTSKQDAAWYGGARRDALHKGGARFVGIYQYLRASQSGAAQADFFHSIVGRIRPGEVFIADFEEGQEHVLSEWYARMRFTYGDAIGPYLWTYSGLAFEQAQGVTAEWVAAYRATEPAVPHRLWQFTSSMTIPGISGACDCSVFHGTVDQLAALAWQAPAAPPPPAAPSYPVPARLSQTVQPIPVHFGWEPGTPLSPHWRWQLARWAGGKPGEVVASDVVTSPRFAATVPGPGEYAWRVQAAGDSPFTPWREFTA
jgi:hypothetical protein